MSPISAADATAITQAARAKELQIAVAKKSHDAAKAEGAAVVKLIEAAASFTPGELDVRG